MAVVNLTCLMHQYTIWQHSKQLQILNVCWESLTCQVFTLTTPSSSIYWISVETHFLTYYTPSNYWKTDHSLKCHSLLTKVSAIIPVYSIHYFHCIHDLYASRVEKKWSTTRMHLIIQYIHTCEQHDILSLEDWSYITSTFIRFAAAGFSIKCYPSIDEINDAFVEPIYCHIVPLYQQTSFCVANISDIATRSWGLYSPSSPPSN